MADPVATMNPHDAAPFRQACDMEEPLSTVRDLLEGLWMIGGTLESEEAGAIQSICRLALQECEVAEQLRVEIFRKTHPNADELEAEWARREAAE